MANYELVALVEGTPQLRAPTASDSASLAGNLGIGVTPSGQSRLEVYMTNGDSYRT
jgi:hypothetical protein